MFLRYISTEKKIFERVFPVYIYLFKVINRNTRKRLNYFQISGVFIVNTFFIAFIVDFEELNVNWVSTLHATDQKSNFTLI